MGRRDPLVSVYLPTRDRARIVIDAVRSVQQQTFQDFELLVVDDGSIDHTWTVLKKISISDDRIKLIRNEKSYGAPAARNIALDQARGQFVTGLDDDDLFLPNRLKNFISAWTGRHSLICSAFWRERSGSRRKLNVIRRTISHANLLHYNMVGNQVFALTKAINSVGGFDLGFVGSQDYDLWVRLTAQYGEGLRISSADYIVRESIATSRISCSEKFSRGARQFTEKHQHSMSRAQLRSQALLHKITAGKPVSLLDARDCFAWGSAALFFKYWMKSNVEAFRKNDGL